VLKQSNGQGCGRSRGSKSHEFQKKLNLQNNEREGRSDKLVSNLSFRKIGEFQCHESLVDTYCIINFWRLLPSKGSPLYLILYIG